LRTFCQKFQIALAWNFSKIYGFFPYIFQDVRGIFFSSERTGGSINYGGHSLNIKEYRHVFGWSGRTSWWPFVSRRLESWSFVDEAKLFHPYLIGVVVPPPRV